MIAKNPKLQYHLCQFNKLVFNKLDSLQFSLRNNVRNSSLSVLSARVDQKCVSGVGLGWNRMICLFTGKAMCLGLFFSMSRRAAIFVDGCAFDYYRWAGKAAQMRNGAEALIAPNSPTSPTRGERIYKFAGVIRPVISSLSDSMDSITPEMIGAAEKHQRRKEESRAAMETLFSLFSLSLGRLSHFQWQSLRRNFT